MLSRQASRHEKGPASVFSPIVQIMTESWALHRAVEQENVKEVRALLSCGKYDVNLQDKRTLHWRRTPLHLACAKGNLKLIKLLVSYGADLTVRDYKWHTPLTLAAANTHYECAVAMVKELGCDPNIKGSSGRTLLHYACADGITEIVLMLVQNYKADLTIRDDFNDTPLVVALKHKHNKIWKSLVCDHGYDPKMNDSHVETLLHLACSNGNIDLVDILVQDY